MTSHSNSETKGFEVDLSKIWQVIWVRKYQIIKISSLFIPLGLLIAFTTPEEFRTRTILMPEVGDASGSLGGLGGLSGLAGLAGFDLNSLGSSNSNTISPTLYYEITQSTPFLLGLMDEQYYFAEIGDTLSIYTYFDEHVKTSLFDKAIALPFTTLSWVKYIIVGEEELQEQKFNDGLIRINEDQKKVIEQLKERIFVEIDYDVGYIVISAEMQDPLVASMMAQYTLNYITEYVTNYSIAKEQKKLEFISSEYERAKERFVLAQIQLANFRDKNRNINTSIAKTEEERLQSEYNLTFSLYNELSQNMEQVKISLNEVSPIFTILEPIKVPIEDHKPNRLVILIATCIMGFFLVIAYFLIKDRNTYIANN